VTFIFSTKGSTLGFKTDISETFLLFYQTTRRPIQRNCNVNLWIGTGYVILSTYEFIFLRYVNRISVNTHRLKRWIHFLLELQFTEYSLFHNLFNNQRSCEGVVKQNNLTQLRLWRIIIFLNLTPYSPAKLQSCFGGMYCFSFQGISKIREQLVIYLA
jgi:hypothetical protein